MKKVPFIGDSHMKFYALGLPLLLIATYGFFAHKAHEAAQKNNGVLTKAGFIAELQPITPAGAQKYNN
jgi:hypothetical protein